MDNHEKNIFQLLKSQDITNVELAIQLNKGLENPIDWQPYLDLYDLNLKSVYSTEQSRAANSNKALEDKLHFLFGSTYYSLPKFREEQKLKNLPPILLELEHLENVSFDNQKLTCIPSGIQKLKNLTRLNANNNLLSDLPDELAQLNKLEKISLSKNKFKTIPSCIFKLPNLRTLNLDHNALKEIPKEIYDIPTLEELGIHSNIIHLLDLNRFKTLQKLYLYKEPIDIEALKIQHPNITYKIIFIDYYLHH